MMSKLRMVFAALLVGALAACHSGVKLNDKGAAGNVGQQPNPVSGKITGYPTTTTRAPGAAA